MDSVVLACRISLNNEVCEVCEVVKSLVDTYR
jgi:hypothetical protein